MTMRNSIKKSSAIQQQGLTLIEALVAVLLLGLGVLALLGVQLSTLTETQNTTRRGHAIRIMEDLSERIKSNPNGFSQLSSFVYPSDEDKWIKSDALPPDATCAASAGTPLPCTAEVLAAQDLHTWSESALATLPTGTQLKTFLSAGDASSDQRQLGIMIAWPLREVQKNATKIDRPEIKAGTVTCPGEGSMLCHLIYVQP